MLKIGALAALTLGAAAVRAADPVVSARFSADSVMIGDQFSLDIRVDKDVMEVVDFPVFNGFLSDSADIEILAESPVDTLKAEGRRITLGKSYLLAGFDEVLALFVESRQSEGDKLKAVIEQRLEGIEGEVTKVRAFMPQILDWQRQRLVDRLAEAKLDCLEKEGE